jgi:hypothetical protein
LERIRIVLAMPPILRDIVKTVFAAHADLDVVAELDETGDVLEAVLATRPELIVWSDGTRHADVDAVFEAQPRIKLLSVVQDGREGVLCTLVPNARNLGELSIDVLTREIRAAIAREPSWSFS